MKKLTIFTFATLLASSAVVYAANDHDHKDTNKTDSSMSKSSMQMGSDTGMMSMPPKMQEKMHKMRADMMNIQQEKDPKKRKAMMSSHMKDMQSMMTMMKNQRSMMQDKHMGQMKQLESRLAMMEAMMEQVVSTHITSLNPDDPVYTIDSMD